jgi:hypothetical protein
MVHSINNNHKTKDENMGQLVSDVTEVLNYKDAKRQAKSQRQEILAQMASDNTEKTNLIKKVLATQRAKYGASGMSNNSITEGAVLKRLKDEMSASYNEKDRNNLAKLKNTKVTKTNLLKKLLDRFDDLIG